MEGGTGHGGEGGALVPPAKSLGHIYIYIYRLVFSP